MSEFNVKERAERIASYLRTKMPEASNLTVTHLERLSVGHSRENLAVRAEFDNAARHESLDMVFRIEQGGVFGTKSEQEYRIIEALHGGPIPVARPLWIEYDESWLDNPFFVMERIEGDSASVFTADAKAKESYMRQFMQILAKLHRTDPKELGLEFMGIPKDTRESTLRQIGFWEKVWRENYYSAEPLFDEAIIWLKNNVPEPQAPPSLIHGDPGAGNFIQRDGKIVALTDWEFSNLGDPMEDVAFFTFLRGSGLAPKDLIIKTYEEVVGIPVSPKNLHYWAVFNFFKGACANISTLRVFCEGKNYGLNLAAIGAIGYRGHMKRITALLDEV